MTPKTKITAAVLVTILLVVSTSYADIWTDPTSFNVSTPEGCRVSETLTIGNNGAEVINFMIRTRQVSTSGENTILSSGAAQRDFTQIAPNASYQPGRLIVRFAQSSEGQMAAMERRNQILSSVGGASIEREFQIVPGLCVVDLPAGMAVEEALQEFNSSAGVLYAEPDYEVTIDSTIPNDTLFGELWGMNNTGQSGGTVDADIDAPEAWDISTGSSDIIVAVIDTGVDYTHPDLAGNMWVNTGEIPGNGQDDDGNGYIDDVYGYDFVNNDGNPMDDHYHGTHCAGTIGGIGNNNQGVAGVCWNVRIMAVKFLNSAGSGSTSNAILSVQYSTLMGANLSSNSWGGGGYSQGLKDAIDAAGAAGMLFVAAAGNNGGNNDNYPHYPSSYDSESLIAVMATDRYDNKSSFSNYGPVSVDLGAPGSEILSCKPGNQYQYLNGTSMATPHVAGACALLWSMNPAADNVEIKNILIETVDPTLSGQCVSGGRLNLYNAILEVKAPWIIIEPEEGTIGAGGSTDVNVTFDALELTPGIYEAEIVVISNDPCSPSIIPVTMTVTPDDLQVAPAEGFESSGTRGGPFTPECMSYTLTNNGASAVSWTTEETEDWVEIEPNEGVLDPCDSTEVSVCITPDANLLDPNIYDQMLAFENTNSGSIKLRLVTLTVKPPDGFTELFDADGSDLASLSLTFSPDGSGAYYEACREKVDEFFTDPNGGINVLLGDDDFAEVVLSNDANILFYGSRYDRFYIGSNGYITFEQGDMQFSPSLQNHFNLPRISALFADLTPSDNISYKELNDRISVTFQNVWLFGEKTKTSSFQIEMFYADGTIRITWLEIAPVVCVAGLSEGYGLPPYFLESDLSEYVPCRPRGDFNRDYYVDIFDLAIFVSHWLEENCGIPYWCDKTDLDFSGMTELADYAIFAENWLIVEDWWLQPIAHWKFDEGSGTIAYDSAGNNDGTLTGDPCWVTGKIGSYALDFDGSGDYVSVGNTVTHNLPKGTFAAWVNPADLSNNCGGNSFAYIMGANSCTGGELGFRVNGDGSGWAMVKNGVAGGTMAFPVGSVIVGSWCHVAMTWDGSYWKVYINGVEKDSKSVSQGTSSATNTAFIGKGWDGCTWNGKIDDVRFYDMALSAGEIWQLYWGGLGSKAFSPNPANGAAGVDPNTVLIWSPAKDAASHDVYLGIDFDDVNDADVGSPEYMGNFDVNAFDPCGLDISTIYYWRIDEVNGLNLCKGDVWSFMTRGEFDPNLGLVSLWKFDEGSGGIAYDSAGDNDGTITGASWSNDPCRGMCLDFDGSGDYVSVGNTVTHNLPKGTFTAWVNPADLSSTCGGWNFAYIMGANSCTGGELGFRVNGDGSGWAMVKNGVAGGTMAFPAGSVIVGSWCHVAMTWDGSYWKVYINGFEKDSKSVSQGTSSATNTALIGKGWDGCSWNGKIDDVRFYDRALSAEEILQLYQQGLE